MNSSLTVILFFIFVTSCSLDNKTRIWSDNKVTSIEDKKNITEVFKKSTILKKEFNQKYKFILKSKFSEQDFFNNYNNSARSNFNNEIKKSTKFRFSKIKRFSQIEPEVIFDNTNIIFFNNEGTIIKFDSRSKKIWEKNYYIKAEKKMHPRLFFAKTKDTLIIADNISKYYSINTKTGDLLWSKFNSAPFNSQIKISKDKFFVTDLDNILYCFSIRDGKKLWSYSTQKSFFKSQKKLSLIIHENLVIFNNSIGDVTALNIEDGSLIWQTPTQNTLLYENTFLLKTSDMVADKKSIIFSNNLNELFSLDITSGILNWQQKVNSDLRPTIIENLILTVSMEGYLILIDKNKGNILRVTDIFDVYKKRKRNKVKPVGFLVGSKNIYLTTDDGNLFTIDIYSGKTILINKIDNNKISRPFILNKNLFIIKDNYIVKMN